MGTSVREARKQREREDLGGGKGNRERERDRACMREGNEEKGNGNDDNTSMR